MKWPWNKDFDQPFVDQEESRQANLHVVRQRALVNARWQFVKEAVEPIRHRRQRNNFAEDIVRYRRGR